VGISDLNHANKTAKSLHTHPHTHTIHIYFSTIAEDSNYHVAFTNARSRLLASCLHPPLPVSVKLVILFKAELNEIMRNTCITECSSLSFVHHHWGKTGDPAFQRARAENAPSFL